jgi:hypothetical protein
MLFFPTLLKGLDNKVPFFLKIRVIFCYIIDHVTNHRESWAAMRKFGDHDIFGRLKQIVFVSKIEVAVF